MKIKIAVMVEVTRGSGKRLTKAKTLALASEALAMMTKNHCVHIPKEGEMYYVEFPKK